MIIAIDFDGTIVEHKFPKIGEPRKNVFRVLKQLKKDGHKLILWTCRDGKYLDEAVDFCKENGIEFDAINNNIKSGFMPLPKIYADLYIDDRGLMGIPSDWNTIYNMI